jgi:hypothetical protein
VTPPTLTYTKRRVESFLAEVRRLKESEFPYHDSEAALREIEVYFDATLGTLRGARRPEPSRDHPTRLRDGLKGHGQFSAAAGLPLAIDEC